MPWPKKPYQTEISSPAWKLATAKQDYTCESSVCQPGAMNTAPQVHPIPRGAQYAYNTTYQAHYCLECFAKWAPREAVRRLGLTPPPSVWEELEAQAAANMVRYRVGDAIRWREPNRGILSGTVAKVVPGDRDHGHFECDHSEQGTTRRYRVRPGWVAEDAAD